MSCLGGDPSTLIDLCYNDLVMNYLESDENIDNHSKRRSEYKPWHNIPKKEKYGSNWKRSRQNFFVRKGKKRDEVYQRILDTESQKSFLYHSGNICYKPYMLSKNKIEQLTHEEL